MKFSTIQFCSSTVTKFRSPLSRRSHIRLLVRLCWSAAVGVMNGGRDCQSRSTKIFREENCFQCKEHWHTSAQSVVSNMCMCHKAGPCSRVKIIVCLLSWLPTVDRPGGKITRRPLWLLLHLSLLRTHVWINLHPRHSCDLRSVLGWS